MIKKSPLNYKAFTLVELLVSVGIAAFMMVLITVTVSQTIKITSIGTATSKMIRKSQVVANQLREDFQGQIGPDSKSPPDATTNPSGFMVIIQQEINGTTERDPYEAEVDRGFKSDGTTNRPVRSDQIFFFYNNDGADSKKIYPICPETNTSFTPTVLDPSDTQACIWYGHLMPTTRKGIAAFDTLLGASTTQRSDLWMLGRQVLFPAPTSISTNYLNSLDVTDAITTPLVPSSLITSPTFYMGMTDIINQNHDDILLAVDGATNADYKTEVEKLVYGPTNRLWANPIPYLNTADNNYTMASWQIAQTHPILMDNVSDFAIDMAFDVDNNGLVDTDGNDEIIWYSNFPNSLQLDGPITSNVSSVLPSTSFISDHSTFATTGARTIVFRHDDDTSSSRWPMLLRFRFRIHDKKGHLLDADSKSGIWTEVIISVNRPAAP